ncbi:InlB B-repeat-containing protein [Faecalicatena orotica]|uniref:InlB B-repeat-containing protein n=1 Tax=Faecalicatena orotica TaxID=1544 RepID=UPI0032179D90
MIRDRKRSRWLVLPLTLCLVISAFTVTAFAEETVDTTPLGSGGNSVIVGTWDELKSEVEKVDGAAEIRVDSELTADSVITVGRTVAICSEGGPFTITRGDGFKGNFFAVKTSKVDLSLSNIVLDGNGGTVSECSQLVLVNNGANLTLKAGAVLQNNNASPAGGGVYVYGASITMEDSSSVTGNTSLAGSGGVAVTTGSRFTMNGGSITRNTMNGNSMSYGGGVAVSNVSSFTMSGGTISNNTSKTSGGGVYVNNSGFTMVAGMITDNKATNTDGWGGGVFVTHSAVFTMEGGSITGNVSSAGGGGVAVTALATNFTGEFDMQGGTVAGNTLSDPAKRGTEVYADTDINLSGEVQIGAGKKGAFLDGGLFRVGQDGLKGDSWVFIEEMDGAAENSFVATKAGTASEAEAAYFTYLSGAFVVVPNVEGYVLKAKEAPSLTGPDTMSLEYGYAASVSEEFTVTGAPAPVVKKTSGSDSITWDDGAKKLNIAAGLDAGTYPVTLVASNGVEPDASHIFTLTVSAPVLPDTYSLSFDADGGSPVPAVQTLESGAAPAAVADPVKNGYTFLGWYDDADKKVDLSAFRMPEKNVLLKAKWEMADVPKADYKLTVENGTGGGRYEAGRKVTIQATVPKGKVFVRWEIKSGTGALEKADSRQTVFTMSESDAVVRAVFRNSTTPQTGDHTNITVWLALLFTALAGCTVLLVFRKHRCGKRH